jgi:branched-chain amino acid transport system permease protein
VAVLGPILETLIGGLLTGVLYSLVALGFVLIFKASGVFNFAQGAMVLFAALTLARLAEVMPMVLAIALTVAIMIALAYAIELLVLRHLVNQEGIILFMATLGVAYFLDGFGQTLWGSDIYKIDLGLPRDPIFLFESVFPGGLLVDPTELIAAVICAVLVAVLAVFFQVTRIGRALRAVADDHQAAQSVGIPLDYIWLIVWAVAGIVALVGGMMWGVKLGVQFSLAQIALKALPVLILGGFTSIPGAIVGGLIIGAGEKLAEVLLGPVLIRTFDLAGGGIENWFAYMLALLFLLVRPQGLFGEKIIERV